MVVTLIDVYVETEAKQQQMYWIVLGENSILCSAFICVQHSKHECLNENNYIRRHVTFSQLLVVLQNGDSIFIYYDYLLIFRSLSAAADTLLLVSRSPPKLIELSQI